MSFVEQFTELTRPERFVWLNEPSVSRFGAGLEIAALARVWRSSPMPGPISGSARTTVFSATTATRCSPVCAATSR